MSPLTKLFLKSAFLAAFIGVVIPLWIKYSQTVAVNTVKALGNENETRANQIRANLLAAKEKSLMEKERFLQNLYREKEEERLAKEMNRQMEISRFHAEIAKNKAAELKRAEFERQYKPRPECNDPSIEWEKSVKCTNEKITAREAFYSK